MRIHMDRNVVYIRHNDSYVYLDVDRVVAVDPDKREIYFEDVVWTLNDADYMEVFNAWMQ